MLPLLLLTLSCAKPVAVEAAPSVAAPAYEVRDDGVVRVEGAPQPTPELSARLHAYLQMRSASVVGLSPDGKRLAISTRFGEVSQLHVLDMPGGARRQVTFREEPVGGIGWTPDGDLLFSADVGGAEQYQLFRQSLSTGRATRLTDGESRNGQGSFGHTGAAMAYSSTARNNKDHDIWVSDGRDPSTARLLVEAEGAWFPSSWSPDDSLLVAGEYMSSTHSNLHLVDVATGSHRLLTDGDPAYHGDSAFHPDGKQLYVVSDRDGEYRRLWSLDLKGGAWAPLTDDIDWNVEAVVMSPSGDDLLFTVNDEGYSKLYRLDVDSGSRTAVEGAPPGILRGLSFAKDADVASFTVYGATTPGDAYTYDLAADAVTRWTESEVGGLDTSTFIEPELVRYESFDGELVPAFYYRPPGDGPFPVLIKIHGGPEGQARPYLSSTTQFMAVEAGVAVLVPNVRGSSGYGTDWLKADNGMLREDSVKDIGALLDWVATQPDLDAARVGVSGGSYGGYMVLASLVHFGDRLVAGADSVGIANFVTFLENTKAYRRDLRRVEYGDERIPEMRAFLEEISPVNRADEINSALFVSHGANDPRVPVGEAEQIVAAVRENGHDVWYVLARNEGHGFKKKENRDLWAQLWVGFFEQHLVEHAD